MDFERATQALTTVQQIVSGNPASGYASDSPHERECSANFYAGQVYSLLDSPEWEAFVSFHERCAAVVADAERNGFDEIAGILRDRLAGSPAREPVPATP